MAPTQLMMATSSRAVTLSTMNSGFALGEGADNCLFPAGLRVLVVDDDPICLLILDRMLRRCLYKVTTCGRAIEALNILRENKDGFDLVISDVYMPDMDGFKLLELVGLEMDLPVIMMSTNGETSAVMKGIEHGACNYLLKPVRIEELKNIWQHVVRRQKKDAELSSNFEDRQQDNYGELHTSASDEPDGVSRLSKRRKDEEEDTEQDNEDPSIMKKPRVVWSVELHQQFVNAVNQLGIDKAVPKRILDLMDVRGLTRENVASHLQKYRLYLRRISGVAHQAGGLSPMFGGASEATFGGVPGDLRSQLSTQVLVSNLQAGRLGRLGSNNSGTASVNQSLLHIAAITGNSGELARSSYRQPSINSSGNLHPSISNGFDLKNISNRQQQIAPFSQPEKEAAQLSALQQYLNSASSAEVRQLVGLNSCLPIKTSNKSVMLQTLQQQTSSQLEIGTTLDTSTGRQQILPGEIGAEILNVDSLNNGLSNGVGSHLKAGQESSLSNISLTSSNGFDSFRRNVGMDIQNLNLCPAGNVNIDLPSSISSSSISCGNDSRTITNKGFVSDAGDSSPWSGGVIFNSVVLSGSNPGSGFHMGQNNWQSLGFMQELGKTTSNDLSPLCNQSFSGQAIKASSFQNSAIVDTSTLKPSVATAPQCDQLSRESELDYKEDPFEPLLEIKAERETMLEPVSSPDDLLNAYFKQQQQEMMGLSEGDCIAEGYALSNMYVK